MTSRSGGWQPFRLWLALEANGDGLMTRKEYDKKRKEVLKR